MPSTVVIAKLLDRVDPRFPFTLVDVGAYGGLEPEWDSLRRCIRVISFEPDKRDEPACVLPSGWLRFSKVLADRSTDLKFYIAQEPGKSSIFQPNFAALSAFPRVERFTTVREVVIPAEQVTTLDDVVRDHGVGDVDFLKLDVQGAELAVLAGSRQCLTDSFVGMKLEVEFFPIYRGQCLFAETDEHVRSHGFELLDLRRAYWKHADYADFHGKGQLIFGDALYVRSAESLSVLLARCSQVERRSKLLKCVVSCLAYGMHPYAVHLVRRMADERLVDKEFCFEMAEEIMRDNHRKIRISSRIYRSLRSVAGRVKRAMLPPRDNWAEGDQRLGNP